MTLKFLLKILSKNLTYGTYHEYMQVGKGRDVGINQISKFEAKVANGNSEQTISRDIYRLGHRFDFFRMLSCYFTIGFYFISLLYLVLSGLEKAILLEAKIQNIQSLETALAPQSYIQLGLLTGLPMVMEIGLERGFLIALKDFFLMQLQLAAAIFTFNLGTKSHYYGRTILHEGAKNYRLYSRSHFMKGFELLLLLVVYDLFSRSYRSSMAYVLITYAVWFFAVTWLFAPFLFNPSGFNWGKVVDDWKDWNKWIKQQGGIGIQQDKSRQSWWNDEQAHHRHSGLCSRLIEGTGLWHFTWVFARAYDYGMGVVLFAPTASLAWLPIISDFQTHFLLNEAFSSRRLQIEPILAGKKSSIDEPLPHVIVYITF